MAIKSTINLTVIVDEAMHEEESYDDLYEEGSAVEPHRYVEKGRVGASCFIVFLLTDKENHAENIHTAAVVLLDPQF